MALDEKTLAQGLTTAISWAGCSVRSTSLPLARLFAIFFARSPAGGEVPLRFLRKRLATGGCEVVSARVHGTFSLSSERVE